MFISILFYSGTLLLETCCQKYGGTDIYIYVVSSCVAFDLNMRFAVRKIDAQIRIKAEQRCRWKLEKEVNYLKVTGWTPERGGEFKHGFRDFRETDHVS